MTREQIMRLHSLAEHYANSAKMWPEYGDGRRKDAEAMNAAVELAERELEFGPRGMHVNDGTTPCPYCSKAVHLNAIKAYHRGVADGRGLAEQLAKKRGGE